MPESVRRQVCAQLDDQAKAATQPGRRPWSAAVPCGGEGGVRFASKTERRVWERLRAALRPGETLVRQVRMPLLSLAPDGGGKPLYLTVDFAVLSHAPAGDDRWTALSCGLWVRWVEAKCRGRVSRDWRRGRAAWEATWGPIVEWDGIGPAPGGA
jgi:hypothetical protein